MSDAKYKTRESRIAIAKHIAGMTCDEIVITPANIRCIMSYGNGITAKGLEALGMSWPPVNGWLPKALGQKIKRSLFLSLIGKDIAGEFQSLTNQSTGPITCPCCGHSFTP